MTKHLFCLIFAGIGVFAAGCRNGAEKTTASDLPPQNLTPQWEAQLRPAKDEIGEIHVRDKSVFVYSKKHRVFVVDRAGGAIQNIYTVSPTAGTLYPPVLLADSIVYPTNIGMDVYDYKGNYVRTIDPGAAIRGPAAGGGKLVYVGADFPQGGRLLSIDLVHLYKPVRWELMTRGGVSSMPAVYQGVVYCGGEDGRVYAVSEDRAAIWPIEGGVFVTNGRILADVKVDEFGVYVASTDSKLYCLARASGKIRWQYFAGAPLTEDPVVTSDFVYELVRGQGIVAILKTEGAYNRSPKWTAVDAVKFLSEDEKYSYLARQDGSIVAVDKMNGEQKFSSQTKFAVFGTNTKDGIIYAATAGGDLVAAKPVLRAAAGGQVALELEPVAPVAAAR